MEIGDRRKRTEDRIVHTADLDDLLANQRAIAIVWDIQHVKDQRPDLGDEQAWEVLQECQQCHERLNDPMLETIRQVADNLYPAATPGSSAQGGRDHCRLRKRR